MSKQLKRRRQIAVKIEGTEGTAETLAAADVIQVREPTYKPNVPFYQRNIARATLTPLQALPGIKTGTLSFGVELKGSGAASTAPEYDAVLQACGLLPTTEAKLTVGAVASGPFQAGERVTGGTSGAIGIVLFDLANGETDLWVKVISGTFATEVITGSDSGASATSSAVSLTDGILYAPASGSTVPSVTAAAMVDGVRILLYGCRGTLTITGTAGEVLMAQVELSGVLGVPADVALFTGLSLDSTVPPVFLGVSMKLQDDYGAIFQALSINLGNNVTERPDASDTEGVLSYLITGRNPTMTVDPEMTTVASHDFVGKLRSGAAGRSEFSYGSTAGNRMRISMPNIQYSDFNDGDRNELAVADITCLLSGKDDDGEDEIFLLHY